MAAPIAIAAKPEGRLFHTPNDDIYPEKESNKLKNEKRASVRILRMPKLVGQRRRRRRGDGRIRVGGEKGNGNDFDGTTRTESTLGASCLLTSRTSSEWNSVRAGSNYYATDPAVSAAVAATYAASPHQQTIKGCIKIRSTEDSEHMAPAATHVHDAAATEGEKDVRPKNVSFGTIELREYPRVLGDNPAVTNGPPITIDWKHQHETILTVDEYERGLPERRTKSEFMVPCRVRLEWLLKAGHPGSEVTRVVQQVNRDKKRRKQTTRNMKIARLEEAMQSLIRKAVCWIGDKDKDDVLYEQWLDDCSVDLSTNREQDQQKQLIGGKKDA